eukprot:262284-Pleurochrysis_carterae.AAC.5
MSRSRGFFSLYDRHDRSTMKLAAIYCSAALVDFDVAPEFSDLLHVRLCRSAAASNNRRCSLAEPITVFPRSHNPLLSQRNAACLSQPNTTFLTSAGLDSLFAGGDDGGNGEKNCTGGTHKIGGSAAAPAHSESTELDSAVSAFMHRRVDRIRHIAHQRFDFLASTTVMGLPAVMLIVPKL